MWDAALGAQLSHPRKEHFVPLFMVAAAAGEDAAQPILIHDTKTIEGDDPLQQFSEHAITAGYLFQQYILLLLYNPNPSSGYEYQTLPALN
jgi:hypothetical protein